MTLAPTWVLNAPGALAAPWTPAQDAILSDAAFAGARGALDTMMAGLACGEASLLAHEILRDHCEGAIAVPEEATPRWMRRLARRAPPIVAGESAVAGLEAAEIARADPALRAGPGIDPASRILVFGSEGDADPELHRAILSGRASWNPSGGPHIRHLE